MKSWLNDAVFYEIYPQSFLDTNSDGIGDFEGIIRKLDYIKSLGCNAIWMNPCFESPFTDAGYDVSDYKKAAPRYGTNDDLKRLFDEAHAKGIKVILDLVPGHTSWEHPWFKASLKPERNEFSGRYVWTDDMWTSLDGVASVRGSLRGLSDRKGCVAVNFYSTQPSLNYGFAKPTESWMCGPDDPDAVATREAMQDVMDFWLSLGCDGFRVDMAASLIKGDEDGTEIVKFWHKVRAFLDARHPGAVLISEWGEPGDSLRSGFDADFLLHFGESHYNDLFRCEHPYFAKEGKGDISAFVEKYQQYVQKAGGEGLICIPSGNHDMPRLSWKLDDDAMRVAFAFLFSMPGAPFLYYGDEIGMRYLEGLTSVEGGQERTGARTPMQWDCSPNAGFSRSSGENLYICIDPDTDRPNVEKAEADENSLIHEVRRLIALRHSVPQLQSRTPVEFLHAEENAYPFVYRRDDVLVIINPADRVEQCVLKEPVSGGQVIYNLAGGAVCEKGTVTAQPCSAAFLMIE